MILRNRRVNGISFLTGRGAAPFRRNGFEDYAGRGEERKNNPPIWLEPSKLERFPEINAGHNDLKFVRYE
jgi:hypothetical protein